jgi:hypothetical protein
MAIIVLVVLSLSGVAMAQPANVRFTCTDTGSPVRASYFYVQDIQMNWVTTTLMTDGAGQARHLLSHPGDYLLTCKGLKKRIEVLSGQMVMRDNPTFMQQFFSLVWDNKKYIKLGSILFVVLNPEASMLARLLAGLMPWAAEELAKPSSIRIEMEPIEAPTTLIAQRPLN